MVMRRAATARSLSPGFTLIEATISTVILTVMVVAALRTVGAAAKSRALLLERNTAWALANDLMAEILQNVYVEPVDTPAFGREGAELATSRANYDDLDDYDLYTESPPKDKTNLVIPGFTGWTRSVQVTYVNLATLAAAGKVTDSRVKEIRVDVTSPSGKITTIRALRAKVGSYDAQPPSDTTSIEWVGLRLQIGANSPTMITGVDLLNQPSQ